MSRLDQQHRLNWAQRLSVALTGVAWPARWHHVESCVVATLRDRRDVVLAKLSLTASAAIDTAMIMAGLYRKPLLCCQVVDCSLSEMCPAPIANGSEPMLVSFAPCLVSIYVVLSVSSCIGKVFVSMFRPVAIISGFGNVFMRLVPELGACFDFIHVILVILTKISTHVVFRSIARLPSFGSATFQYFISMLQLVAFSLGFDLVWISIAPSLLPRLSSFGVIAVETFLGRFLSVSRSHTYGVYAP